jgi:hypothetical protein
MPSDRGIKIDQLTTAYGASWYLCPMDTFLHFQLTWMKESCKLLPSLGVCHPSVCCLYFFLLFDNLNYDLIWFLISKFIDICWIPIFIWSVISWYLSYHLSFQKNMGVLNFFLCVYLQESSLFSIQITHYTFLFITMFCSVVMPLFTLARIVGIYVLWIHSSIFSSPEWKSHVSFYHLLVCVIHPSVVCCLYFFFLFNVQFRQFHCTLCILSLTIKTTKIGIQHISINLLIKNHIKS